MTEKRHKLPIVKMPLYEKVMHYGVAMAGSNKECHLDLAEEALNIAKHFLGWGGRRDTDAHVLSLGLLAELREQRRGGGKAGMGEFEFTPKQAAASLIGVCMCAIREGVVSEHARIFIPMNLAYMSGIVAAVNRANAKKPRGNRDIPLVDAIVDVLRGDPSLKNKEILTHLKSDEAIFDWDEINVIIEPNWHNNPKRAGERLQIRMSTFARHCKTARESLNLT